MNTEIRTVLSQLFVALQLVLPHHLLSRCVAVLATSRIEWLKNFLIRRFIAAFRVDMTEAVDPAAENYAHFNDFFTRALCEGVRPVDAAPEAIVSPADGAVSQLGAIEVGNLMQAKGHWFSAAELLASEADARLFHGGSFATVYLSPRDYHRVHMPVDATLRSMRYVPGRLFSVNRVTTEGVPRLFARNERLVCLFDTERGPMGMVLVGAMIVAGIETVWSGPVTPAGRGVLDFAYGDAAPGPKLSKGEEMGRFQLGSTVILLFPPETVTWEAELAAGSTLRMGQRIGSRA